MQLSMQSVDRRAVLRWRGCVVLLAGPEVGWFEDGRDGMGWDGMGWDGMG